MSRAVCLSAGGDILLADFCLELWKKHWYNEIDTYYIAYNNHAAVSLKSSYEFLRKWERDPKVRIIYVPSGCGNGIPITQVVFGSKEEALLLLEDDSFIFTPGIVESWFRIIKTGVTDIVGSPRYATGEVADAAREKYKLDYSGVGDKGFGWWPSFFLCKREDLLKTDLDFGSKKYSKGEYFKELDHTFKEDCYTDTFTWASIQLRYMGLRSFDITQNHAHPFDLENKEKKEIMFANGNPLYIHGGSLSSGWGGYLNKKLPPVTTDMEKQDIETRVAFWEIIAKTGKEYDEFRIQYLAAIQRLIIDTNLNRERINKKIQLYKQLMNI